ncbi:MAG TPA: SH3-like domain-containing protein [Actinophytocola sp.]|uniref:SH3-like domain-containing protein n=1 Tax=Actinophytocola sp. TaxID=1872138 RepID=UPI002DBD30FB|nr:SH3-like domain-containing protein [Actinophytocola sp.]HEU5471491.1 SH3-like domain-containing protein [Actinophytocola sp.]
MTLEPGLAVRTRLHSASGHTRLPIYVRGRPGTVHALRGHFPFPDELARHGRAEPQALYCVRFLATDLWGPDAGEHRVYLDLFESYLEIEG